MKQRLLGLLAVLFLLPMLRVSADPAPTQIHTVQDLQVMAQDPSGSYILMADLDMADTHWVPFDFSGTLDGNGHAIFNLTLTQPGPSTAKCYDGNTISYTPEYYGLFGLLENATVTDLQLLGVRCDIQTDNPCMVGALAGYSSHSLITGCTVSSRLTLHAHNGMFGIGGMVGYGTGSIEDCQVDVTLICVDTDADTLDEQFLGGVYAAGFMDVRRCQIAIDGYVSEHGYTHNGGITGLFMRWPIGEGIDGEIQGNHVSGQITFFEDNPDRRAYCSAYAGEILGRYCTVENNTNSFSRNEVWEYGKDLFPEQCTNPSYTSNVIGGDCHSFGYTEHTCSGCGCSFRDAYTMKRHTVTIWETLIPATTESEGFSQGSCDLCGAILQRTDPVLIPPETTAPTEPPAEPAPSETAAPTQPTEPAQTQPVSSADETKQEPFDLRLLRMPAVLILAAVALMFFKKHRRRGKYEQRR